MPKLKANIVDLILETSSALFLCGAAFAVVCLFLQGVHSPVALIVATSLPAAASLVLLVVALLVPGVYAVGRLAFPLNFTLPLIHSSIVFMLAELTRGSFGLESPPDQLRPALWWGNLGFVFLAMAFEVVLLSALIAMKGSNAAAEEQSDVQR